MDKHHPVQQQKLRLLVDASNLYFKIMLFLLTGVVLALLIDVIANIFTPYFIDALPFAKILAQFYHLSVSHPVTTSLIALLLATLFVFASLLRRIEVPASTKEIRRQYLGALIEHTKPLAFEEIPAERERLGVKLEDVFISPLFYAGQLSNKNEYPFLKEDLEDELNEEYIEYESKKCWYFSNTEKDKLSFIELWQKLTKNKPAAVIQGFPGRGKSTLLEGIKLHMAYRGVNELSYVIEQMLSIIVHHTKSASPHPIETGLASFKGIGPALIPVLINLRNYEAYLRESAPEADLSLSAYVEYTISQLNISGLALFLQYCLKRGDCIILLDGLDEVSKNFQATIREKIEYFVNEYRSTTRQRKRYNRFILTSRVFDFDQTGFSESYYSHYLIDELSSEQINKFVHAYFDAIESSRSASQRERRTTLSVTRENGAKLIQDVIKLQEKNKHVRDLTRNSLMLSFLVSLRIQEKNFDLPRQKIELYKNYIDSVLKSNGNRGLQLIDESQIIQCLGGIAMEMQKKHASLLAKEDVLKVISDMTNEQPQQIKQLFEKVRVRGSLFVQRFDDYFGFPHRPIQTYFAARHLLKEIEEDYTQGLSLFLSKASLIDDSWRETILFALAYQSFKGRNLANRLVCTLLDKLKELPNDDFAHEEHIVCLAAECLLEVKPFSIQEEYRDKIVELILQVYNKARSLDYIEKCHIIRDTIRQLINSKENTMPKSRKSFTHVVSNNLISIKDDKKVKAMLEMLAMLKISVNAQESEDVQPAPIRSMNEILFIKQLVADIVDGKVEETLAKATLEMCAKSLEQADPDTEEVKKELVVAKEYIQEQIKISKGG